MALIQINEPSARDAKEAARRFAVGIDLGTTNSLVATVVDGRAQVLTDDAGRAQLPSVVHYAAGEAPVVGTEALARATSDASNTVVSVKRHMGRRPEAASLDAGAATFVDAALAEDETDAASVARFAVAGGARTAVEVSADILKALRARAETVMARDAIDGVVVTVPAYFDDAQRQATRDAAQLAGLKVLRLLNEPTAAAVAYGLDAGDSETIVVYDLGGGTFDVSVLRLDRGVFHVLATGGDSALGGDDFDKRIAETLARDGDVRERDLSTQRCLLNEAAAIKIALSEETRTSRRITLPSGRAWEQTLTRDAVEQLIAPLVDKTITICHDTLYDADIAVADVDKVILVGGATRTPLIRARVAEAFGQTPMTDLNPDTIVAVGAAIQADILVGNRPDDENLLLDVIPLSLGIETAGELVERVVPRNTTIPCAEVRHYTTQKDGQTGISIHVVQGERDLVSDCRSLARFELTGIPPMVAGAARVKVTFRVDADGLLEVEASEETSGNSARVEVKPTYGLSSEAMETMLRASMDNAESDVAARVLREAKVEAQRVIDALDAALQADGDLLDADERGRVDAARSALRDAMEAADADKINVAVAALEAAGESFVAARMNRGIAAVLEGQSIEQMERKTNDDKSDI